MCGIFGIEGHDDAANLTYLGLYALQHRGQESAGITSWDGDCFHLERGMGQVADIFKAHRLKRLAGRSAIGHARYSTAGSSVMQNAQPIVVNTSMGPLAIVHNGNLVNSVELRTELEDTGSIFQTTSDTEVILHLMARRPRRKIVESLMLALERVRGAYSLLVICRDGVIAARDPHGFRPLVMGYFQGAPCFSSESCAFDLLEVAVERELAPGEVVLASGNEVSEFRLPTEPRPSSCAFEQVYFARPDSVVFGDAVSGSRLRLGAQLAREAPVAADIVVPVPDSGVFAALGFSRESGLDFEFGLIRNHYVGRTFIQPKQSIRHFGVKVKLNPVRELIVGRRVVLVDDSIVRGTTSPKIVKMLRDAGASEVHMRISCPPTVHPCHYGIDMPTREELIACDHDLEQIRDFIGADSLAYLSLEGLERSLYGDPETYCTACWTGEYRVPIAAADRDQRVLFPIATEEEGASSGDAYREVGVDIDAQDRALERVKRHVRSTYTEGVLSEAGSFGGLFRPAFGGASEPVLVSSADGVGTKLRVAAMAGDYTGVGRDLVNHCVNDILVQGARPLFFLDYVGAGRLDPATMEEIVAGMAGACRDNRCALLGGETAEMPGFYAAGDYEVVGFILGWVDRPKLIDGRAIRAGDLILGLPSSGLHTNGYTLARHVFFEKLGLGVGDRMPTEADGRTVGEALLAPHLSYLPALEGLLDHEGLHGIAHITGGGLTDNLPRILPDGLHAEIRVGSWEVPELFRLLQEHGDVDTAEMFRVFNMGIGMVVVIDPTASVDLFSHCKAQGQPVAPIGLVGGGGEGVVFNFGVTGSEVDPTEPVEA